MVFPSTSKITKLGDNVSNITFPDNKGCSNFKAVSGLPSMLAAASTNTFQILSGATRTTTFSADGVNF
jgi:hypothetical protein